MSLNDSPHGQEWPPLDTIDALENINDKLTYIGFLFTLYCVAKVFGWIMG